MEEDRIHPAVPEIGVGGHTSGRGVYFEGVDSFLGRKHARFEEHLRDSDGSMSAHGSHASVVHEENSDVTVRRHR